MKNFIKTFRNLNMDCRRQVSWPRFAAALLFIVIIVMVGLSITSCPELDDDGKVKVKDKEESPGGSTGGGGNGVIVSSEQLKLSGQVYTFSKESVSFQTFYRDLEIGNDYYPDEDMDEVITLPGTGEIKAGRLDYTVGKPPVYFATVQQMIDGFTETEMFENVEASDSSVQYFGLNGLPIVNSLNYTGLLRANVIERETRTSYSLTEEQVIFIYLEKDVTITGKGTRQSDYENYEGTPVYITVKSENINLSLKKGWNTICVKDETSLEVSFSGTYYNMTISLSISADNPSCKWMLAKGGSADYSVNIRPNIVPLEMRKNIRPVQRFQQLLTK